MKLNEARRQLWFRKQYSSLIDNVGSVLYLFLFFSTIIRRMAISLCIMRKTIQQGIPDFHFPSKCLFALFCRHHLHMIATNDCKLYDDVDDDDDDSSSIRSSRSISRARQRPLYGEHLCSREIHMNTSKTDISLFPTHIFQ